MMSTKHYPPWSGKGRAIVVALNGPSTKRLSNVRNPALGRNRSFRQNGWKGIAKTIYQVFEQMARSSLPFVAKTTVNPRGVLVNSSAKGVDWLTKEPGMRISWNGIAALIHQYTLTMIPAHPGILPKKAS